MGVKNWVGRIANKAGDKVAHAAALSPEQLQDVAAQKQKYFSEMPDPLDPAQVERTGRLLAANSVEIYNAYLPQLHELYVPVQKEAEYEEIFSPEHNIRYFNITRWVTDKKENSLEKLVNVYDVLSNEECNIALIFHRTMAGTDTYLAVTNVQNAQDNTDADVYKERIAGALKGNFPGSEWKEPKKGTVPCLKSVGNCSVASATNIPTEKSEKFISQTIEKLLDGIVPDSHQKEYTLILLATPVHDVEDRKIRLAEFYSGLAPYAGWSTNYTYQESGSIGSSATVGINVGASAGIQQGQNQSVTQTNGETNSENVTETDSTNKTKTESQNDTVAHSSGESQMHTEGEGWGSSDTVAESNGESFTEGTNHSDSHMEGESESNGFNVGIAKNIYAGINAGLKFGNLELGGNGGVSRGINWGFNHSDGKNSSDTSTDGSSESHTTTQNQTESHTENLTKNISDAFTKTLNETQSHSLGKSIADSVGHSIARSLGRAISHSVSTTEGIFKSINLGVNFGANFARSSTVTATIGKNEGITQNYTNYLIKHTLELLEEQMKRYEQSSALGMWDFAAYVLSEDHNVANNVAHSYLALTQGEKSYMSHTAVNVWRGDISDPGLRGQAEEICGYLQQLRHPVFGLNPEITKDAPTFNVYPSVVTATTSLTGKELAYSLNFPSRSVAGLPVLQCVEFGRNIVTYDAEDAATDHPTMKNSGFMGNRGNGEKADGLYDAQTVSSGKENGSGCGRNQIDTDTGENDQLHLGHIFHMNHTETTPVDLAVQSMASHTFITGSTGSGKSNTVYQILEEAHEKGIHFLVIEPAKGEYKDVFGNDKDVHVYGTNPALTPLLRLNPFRFPEGIHVFEHIDRLVEIFNVCWPMYAAMPAVLKSAVERSYEDCGWDLVQSTNEYGDDLYPNFADVARNIREIIDSSEYDAENKGAYKGSLLTRLQSLTNGINGLIFTEEEIDYAALFDQNVIVDLSRVGSSETKSLLMGMLVLKQQEYRMTSASGINQHLHHLTVLEEAHNLLKRTSTEQPVEGGNLLGKSVEMLANAIAEMRTYGEGFIIVDQAPGLLDLSVIRNTNTKIIMRLPDQEDRELVGKAANLNEDQITELARLPRGVAAVYQNEWVQAVLCKVERAGAGNKRFYYQAPAQGPAVKADIGGKLEIAELLSNGTQITSLAELRDLKERMQTYGLSASVQVMALKMMQHPPKEPRMTKLAPIFAGLFPSVSKAVADNYDDASDVTELTRTAEEELERIGLSNMRDQVRRDIIQGIITNFLFYIVNDTDTLKEWGMKGGGF